jgi:hypothetical protein
VGDRIDVDDLLRRAAHYVVTAAGGGKLGRPSGSRYVAFALPE